MVASITHQIQETVCCPATESLGIYKRLENIIRKVKKESNTPEASYLNNKVYKKNIAHQVKEHKDKTISQSLLLFGTIN